MIRTIFAAAAGFVWDPEIAMPRLYECGLVLSNERRDPIELGCPEAIIVRLPDRRQPELGELRLALDVHVRRLVAITRKEEEAVWAALQNGWTQSGSFLSSFGWTLRNPADVANTPRAITVQGRVGFIRVLD